MRTAIGSIYRNLRFMTYLIRRSRSRFHRPGEPRHDRTRDNKSKQAHQQPPPIPPCDEINAVRVIIVRSKRLPRNQSAGRSDEKHLRTVHQRPAKNITPSKTPVTKANLESKFHLSFFSVPRAFPCLPWRPNARHSNGRSRGRRSTAPASRDVCPNGVCPTRCRGLRRQCRHHHRPADQPHHCQAKPDALAGLACLELARLPLQPLVG